MIVPSIDLMSGRAVQLRRGKEHVFDGGDPFARLDQFAVAGEVTAGLVACGGTAGGFGAKYLAQSKITAIDSSDASTMRISWLSLLFFCGSLTNGPLPV